MSVYIFGFRRFAKIGYSRNPEARRSDLQIAIPAELRRLCVAAGSMAAERFLHEYFAFDHVRGEWFRCSRHLLTVARWANGGRFEIVGDGRMKSVDPSGVVHWLDLEERARRVAAFASRGDSERSWPLRLLKGADTCT